jgi:hypothetical protein
MKECARYLITSTFAFRLSIELVLPFNLLSTVVFFDFFFNVFVFCWTDAQLMRHDDFLEYILGDKLASFSEEQKEKLKKKLRL